MNPLNLGTGVYMLQFVAHCLPGRNRRCLVHWPFLLLRLIQPFTFKPLRARGLADWTSPKARDDVAALWRCCPQMHHPLRSIGM